jgi:hypothetical protein
MEQGVQGTRHGTYSTYWTGSLQEALGRTMDTRDLLARADTARLALAPSLARLSLVGTGSTKLRPNSYKMTKGEGIRKKLKTKSTNNKRCIKKSTRKSKTTHSRGRLSLQITSTIFRNCVGDNGHPLQNLPQAL